MKLLYICSKQIHQIHSHHMAESHYIDLPNGEVLVAAQFRNDHLESTFSDHPDVQALPHPFSGDPVGPEIAGKLAHIGVEKHHRHHHVGEKAGKVHPLMKMRVI